jgi:hypothetical protein
VLVILNLDTMSSFADVALLLDQARAAVVPTVNHQRIIHPQPHAIVDPYLEAIGVIF